MRPGSKPHGHSRLSPRISRLRAVLPRCRSVHPHTPESPGLVRRSDRSGPAGVVPASIRARARAQGGAVLVRRRVQLRAPRLVPPQAGAVRLARRRRRGAGACRRRLRHTSPWSSPTRPIRTFTARRCPAVRRRAPVTLPAVGSQLMDLMRVMGQHRLDFTNTFHALAFLSEAPPASEPAAAQDSSDARAARLHDLLRSAWPQADTQELTPAAREDLAGWLARYEPRAFDGWASSAEVRAARSHVRALLLTNHLNGCSACSAARPCARQIPRCAARAGARSVVASPSLPMPSSSSCVTTWPSALSSKSQTATSRRCTACSP